MMIGYLRVSTEDQGASGLGLDAQLDAIQAACKQRSVDLCDVVREVCSGSTPAGERPGLASVLARLRKGEVAGLIVAKLDRLSRSAFDFARLMRLSQAEGWAIICLDLGIDTTTPSGKMIAQVMSAFAEFELDMIRLRTKDALAAKRRAGAKLGPPVLMAQAIEDQILVARSAGLSWSEIARRLNTAGVPSAKGGRWHASVVSQTWHRLNRPARRANTDSPSQEDTNGHS